jgi:hypothetical protein
MTDEFDTELRDALQARSGGAVGTTLAREDVLGRATTIRRRRAVAAGSGTLVLLAVGALALAPRGDDDRIAPADDATVPSVETTDVDEDASAAPTSTAADTPTTTIAATSTTDADPTTTQTSTAAPNVLGGAAVTTTTGPASAASETTVTTLASASTTAAPAPAATTSPTTTTAAPTGTPPFTKSYQSAGGSITVDWNGTSLSLLAVQPADGYTAEIEDQASARIRVRFRSDGGDSRIEIRADNGQVEEIVS